MINTKLLFQIREKLAATLRADEPSVAAAAKASAASASASAAASAASASAASAAASAASASPSAFDPSNFTEDELRILFQSQLLGSKFCSKEFTQGAIEYLRDNEAKFEREILIHDYNEYVVKNSETLFNKIWSGTIDESVQGHFLKPKIEDGIKYIKQSVEIEHKERMLNLVEFFSLGINLTYNQSLEYILGLHGSAYMLFGDIEIIEHILKQVPAGNKDFDVLYSEGFGNLSWGFDESTLKSFSGITEHKKEFLRDIFTKADDLKVFGTIISALFDQRVDDIIAEEYASSDAVDSSASASAAAAAAGSGSERLTSREKVERALESEFPHALREEIDRKLTGKLDVAKFKSLAKKYKMPTNIVRKLLDDSEAIFLAESNSDKKIAEYFPELRTQSEYVIPLGKGVFDSRKATELVFHSYDDPTALFVGKMTKSCQFYTGHSSDQAVIPVYSKPGCSLISIRKAGGDKQIFASMFAWLGTHAGQTGLVLDSIEFSGEERIKYTPNLLREFSQVLRAVGLKLWVGSGGQTPVLYESDDLTPVAASDSEPSTTKPQIHKAPQPLDKGFKPYGDSSEVYEIDPTKTYSAHRAQTVEFETIYSALNKIFSAEGFTFEEKREIASFPLFFTDLSTCSDKFLDIALSKQFPLNPLLEILNKFMSNLNGYIQIDAIKANLILNQITGADDFDVVHSKIMQLPKLLLQKGYCKILEFILENDVDSKFVSFLYEKFATNNYIAESIIETSHAHGIDSAILASRINELPCKIFSKEVNGTVHYGISQKFLKILCSEDFNIEDAKRYFEENPRAALADYFNERGFIEAFSREWGDAEYVAAASASASESEESVAAASAAAEEGFSTSDGTGDSKYKLTDKGLKFGFFELEKTETDHSVDITGAGTDQAY
jgi:hypothetical protein